MIVNHLPNGVTECISDKAIVRFHPGKLSEEERKAVIDEASKRFFKAVLQSKKGKAV